VLYNRAIIGEAANSLMPDYWRDLPGNSLDWCSWYA